MVFFLSYGSKKGSGANIFGADVRKDRTSIFNKYDEDEIPLEIETITLRDLIDIWLNEHTKLTTEKNNK
ncbi:hypothetical protein JDS87_30370 [Bacillus cereus]|uniref:hypothetical protein n=1 Tax=Bacillus cereus TaxID=1396 RepID=UPI0018F68FAB|nr:hypothetical protein [Bacillus cereus]MBJ8056053.1 hypothetical protein [Bacillus cereus]